jgi:hypothetical protein
LNAVASVGTTVLIAGNTGDIVGSTDSGATWALQASGTANNLLGVAMINPSLIVGGAGTIILSVNQPSGAASGSGSSGFGTAGDGGPGSSGIAVSLEGEWLILLIVVGWGIWTIRLSKPSDRGDAARGPTA